MNIGDKIGLRNMHGDVVEHEVVYVKGAGKEVEWPRVYRDCQNEVWMFQRPGECSFCHFTSKNKYVKHHTSCVGEDCCSDDRLLTGPERDEYVAAAREGRDAVWPKESDPWPHWWWREKDGVLCRVDREHDGECWQRNGRHYVGFVEKSHDDETMKRHEFVRIDEAVAYKRRAEWEAARNSQPAPLPTAEEVAEKVAAQIADKSEEVGRFINGEGRRSWEWIGTYRIAPIVLAAIRERDMQHEALQRKPVQRVKHDWTGAMGTVLMECNGTSFVKWDDGQVTSVYNRHLQKELI